MPGEQLLFSAFESLYGVMLQQIGPMVGTKCWAGHKNVVATLYDDVMLSADYQ